VLAAIIVVSVCTVSGLYALIERAGQMKVKGGISGRKLQEVAGCVRACVRVCVCVCVCV
jgi:hypothetical protein